MLLSSQRRGVSLTEVPGIDEASVAAFAAAGINTVGDLLEASSAEGEPFLASIRTDPRYATLVEELRRSREHFANVYDALRDTISTH